VYGHITSVALLAEPFSYSRFICHAARIGTAPALFLVVDHA
jgi:hypothetical protein